MSDEEYTPAERPPGGPAGDRIRFEREGEHEQSMFGGSAADIAASMIEDTFNNTRMIGAKIRSVRTVKGDLGAGTLQELEVQLDNGNTVVITGIGLRIEVR